MEHITALAINDASLLAPIVERNRELFAVPESVTRGAWGVGFHHNGEILVKKRPITSSLDTVGEISRVPAPQLVSTVTDFEGGSLPLERCLPLRYRNWLFAARGVETLGGVFFDRATEHLRGYITPGRWMETATEAVMMVFIRALHGAGELDHRSLSSDGVHEALAAAAGEVVDLAGGKDGVRLAIVLHLEDHLYALSMGHPVAMREVRVARQTKSGRLSGPRHGRAVLLATRDAGEDEEPVGQWRGVEIPSDCIPQGFGLAS
ncbi:MAG: hypothetical protein ACQEXJ_04480 [Myxococcota bacterium]